MLVFLMVLVSVSAEPPGNITAVEGENVTLPCKTPNNNNHNILAVSWTRPDLGKNHYVFFYRNSHIETDHQLPSYKNRVNLSEELMKDGDVSLILNNVTFNDNGTFQCLVRQTGSDDYLTTIFLSVVPPGEPEEERRKEEREKEERVKEEREKEERRKEEREKEEGEKKEGGKEEGGGGGRVGLIVGLTVAALVVVVVVVVVVKGYKLRVGCPDPGPAQQTEMDQIINEGPTEVC